VEEMLEDDGAELVESWVDGGASESILDCICDIFDFGSIILLICVYARQISGFEEVKILLLELVNSLLKLEFLNSLS
jgi:hypothetical protein